MEDNNRESLRKANRDQIKACSSIPTALQLFSTQNNVFVSACTETENHCAYFRGLMLNGGKGGGGFFFFLVAQRSSCSSMDLSYVHIIETIHHCHLGATGTAVLYRSMYNFLFSSSPGLSPFTAAASGGSLARPFSRPPSLHWHLLAAVAYRPASIISHCKVIRVLIMWGPPSGVIHQLRLLYTCKCKHVCASSAMRVSATSAPHNEPIRWGDGLMTHLQQRPSSMGLTVIAKSIPETCCSSH